MHRHKHDPHKMQIAFDQQEDPLYPIPPVQSTCEDAIFFGDDEEWDDLNFNFPRR